MFKFTEILNKKYLSLPRHYIKWTITSALIGVVSGLIGAGFHKILDLVTEKRMETPNIIYFIPLAGLFIVFLYRALHQGNNHGTNDIMDAVKSGSPVTALFIPLIFISTTITHLFGGSAGREGAALQIGGGIGSVTGRVLRLKESDMRTAILCGMSSTFTALFGTPITATVFTIEFISVGIIHYSAIFPCLIGSITAMGIASLFSIAPTAFTLTEIPVFNAESFALCFAFSVVCAILSIVFCVLMHKTQKLSSKIKNQYLRIFIGGILIIIFTLIIGNRDYNGAGMDVIERAIGGEAVPYAFILKMLLTAITIGFGYKGGEIVPSFFIGATFGAVFGALLGLPPSFCAALGLVGMFCGVTDAPIASMILAIELFGGEGFIFFGIVCTISYILSGRIGLYDSQKHLFSKDGNPIESEALAKNEFFIQL